MRAEELDRVVQALRAALQEGTRLSALNERDRQEHTRLAVADLERAASRDEAERVYGERVLPCEVARILAARDPAECVDLLFVTTGGQPHAPLLATLASRARCVVLLHTPGSEAQATAVRRVVGPSVDEILSWDVGDGKAPVLLYQRMREMWVQKARGKASVRVDITGGLKTMSAAAAVAGFARGEASVCYIDSEQRVIKGFTANLEERRIELPNPMEVMGDLRRSEARALFRAHRYGAAATIFDLLARSVDERVGSDRLYHRLSEALGQLEQLEFTRAAKQLDSLATDLDRLAPTRPEEELVRSRDHLRALKELSARLAAVLTKSERSPVEALQDDGALDLAAFLLSAADRRSRDGLHDVAVLLGYRVMELLVQRRAASFWGIDSGKVDWDALEARLQSRGMPGQPSSVAELIARHDERAAPEGRIGDWKRVTKLARVPLYSVLAALGDPFAPPTTIEQFGADGAARNNSILAHGLQKTSPGDATALLTNARKLLKRLLECEGKSQQDLQRSNAWFTLRDD